MSRVLSIPETVEFLGVKPPKIIAKHVVKSPDLELAGVYMWIYDRRYVYIGSAKRLQKRLREHCRLMTGTVDYINTSRKHKHVARKYGDTAELYVLENGAYDMQRAYDLERKWLAYFHKIAPKEFFLNDHMIPGGGMANKKAMKKRWTPEARRARSEFMKQQARKQWEDPEFRAMQMKVLEKARRARRAKRMEVRLISGQGEPRSRYAGS